MNHRAAFSPEDNKLRIYPASRLDAYDWRGAGYRWAPKQECFFAVWSPEAEDFALDLCGDIEDEDKSLVERAEERADRFTDYSTNRLGDAENARAAVSAIADNIPLGQPILVGHHSERHARRDAAKIENGMRRAVSMWKKSEYWKQRAASALRHAKYKELPAVRARRIKTLEAELRKVLRSKESAADLLKLWTANGLTLERARFISGHTVHGNLVVIQEGNQSWNAYDVLRPEEERYKACPACTVEEVQEAARKHHARVTTNCERWIEHLSNRLEYEHAMLEDQGAAHLLDKKPKSAAAQLPLCNYRAPQGIDIPNGYNHGKLMHYAQVEMTQAEYAKIYKDYKGTHVVGNSHRVRTCIHHEKGGPSYGSHVCVFLTDSKVHTPPVRVDPLMVEPPHPTHEQIEAQIKRTQAQTQARELLKIDAAPFQEMAEALKTGVKVVSVNQLFPTPSDVARHMMDVGDIQPGQRVLEPSAGTGNLIRAIIDRFTGLDCGQITAVESNYNCVHSLEEMSRKTLYANDHNFWIKGKDFLECTPEELGFFHRIVMNPPFENGADIKHILHARTFLKPGGRLVAICANGPRQQAKLQPLADTWEELPGGTFEGTGVRTALLTISNPICRDCREPLGDAESMVRNNGELSHLEPCSTKS